MNGGRQRGVALLVVLWACTLLAILVGGLAAVSRTEALQTRFTLGQQRARYAAEAGVAQAMAVAEARQRRTFIDNLSPDQPQADPPLPGDGRSVSFVFDHMQVAIAVLDETGKVDLNTAEEPVLRGLFTAAGCTRERAETLAASVVEWRTPSPGGPVDDGRQRYADAGLSYGPRHAQFVSIEELQAVLGMDTHLYAVVEPAITVWSGGNRPQADYAPALALAALPGMDLALAEAVVKRRDAAPAGTVLEALPAGLVLGGARPGNTFTFRAVADDGHGMRAQVEATVQFARQRQVRNPRVPIYKVVRWRDGISG